MLISSRVLCETIEIQSWGRNTYMRLGKIMIFAAAAFMTSSSQLLAANLFPPKYEGVWVRAESDIDACKASDWKGVGRNDDDRLMQVSGRSVLFFESSCDLTSLRIKRVPAGYQKFIDGSAMLTMSCSGEGQRSKEAELWDVQKLNGRDFLITSNSKSAAISVFAKCN